MPFTPDVIHEINVYLQHYVKSKTTGSDIAQKQKEITRIQSLITSASLRRSPETDWINILLEIGKVADESQRSGTYCSKFTETLYMVLHRLRREISRQTLDEIIQKERSELAVVKSKYIAAKKANHKIEALQEHESAIEERIYRLTHLGDLDPILELDLEDSAALFKGTVKKPLPLQFVLKLFTSGELEEIKGYEYSDATTAYHVPDVNTSLPLVVQHGNEKQVFEKIFLAKYLNGKRPEPKDDLSSINLSASPTQILINASPATKEFKLKQISPLLLAEEESRPVERKQQDAKESISPSFALEVSQDLTNYTLGKTHGFDLALKIKECNEISSRLSALSQKNTSTDEWIDLVIYIGEQADRIQGNGTTCSGCTEVFYYIMHKLRQEINKNSPNSFASRLEKDKKELANLQSNFKNSKCNNETRASLEQAESAINKARRSLAYLGYLDPLLNLKQDKLEKIYYGTYSDTPLVSTMMNYLAGSPIRGFEYTRTPRPYDLPNTFCIYLPVVLQPAFTNLYLKKYERKLKMVIDAKMALENSNRAISELELEIKKINSLNAVTQLKIKYNEDEKTLLSNDITFDFIQNLISQLSALELAIQTTQSYVDQVTGEKKDDLVTRLMRLKEELSLIQKPSVTILKIFQNAQQEKEKVQQEMEHKAEQTALIEISELTEKITQFAKESTLTKIIALKDKEIADIKEAKVTSQEINFITDKIATLDSASQQIKLLIDKANRSKQKFLTEALNKQNECKKLFSEAVNFVSQVLKKSEEHKEHADSEIAIDAKELVGKKDLNSPGTILSLLQQKETASPAADAGSALENLPTQENVPAFSLEAESDTYEQDFILEDEPAANEIKANPPLVGAALRQQLFEKIAELRGVLEHNKANKIAGWEKAFSQDKNIIQRFKAELEKAGKGVDEDFLARASL